MKSMKSILLFLSFCCALFAQTAFTPVSDTAVVNPDGSVFSGTLYISIPAHSIGSAVSQASTISVTVNNGILNVSLPPTDQMSPAGLTYSVVFVPSGKPSFNATWSVKTSASSLALAALQAGIGSSSGGSGSSIATPSTTTVGNIPAYGNTTGSVLNTGYALVTTVGSPGSNGNIPSEQAVHTAIAAASVGSSAALYGSYGSIPSTCTTGATYFITSGNFDTAICTTTNTWTYYYQHRAITPASALGLTSAGTSGPTVTNTNGYDLMTLPGGGSSNTFIRYWTAPTGSSYTVTLAVKPAMWFDEANYRQTFYGWGDGSTGYLGVVCGVGSSAYGASVGCAITALNMNGSSNHNNGFFYPYAGESYENVNFIRMNNTSGTLTISFCSDWDSCWPAGSSAASAFLTGSPSLLAYGAVNSASGTINATLIGVQ